MSKSRARYAGPFNEVVVQWPPGETRPSETQSWTVKQNHWLPDDAPAKLRDELLASADWSEVEQQPAVASSSKKED